MIPVCWDESVSCFTEMIIYIRQLHVQTFISARRDPSFALPRLTLSDTKFSHVIISHQPPTPLPNENNNNNNNNNDNLTHA